MKNKDKNILEEFDKIALTDPNEGGCSVYMGEYGGITEENKEIIKSFLKEKLKDKDEQFKQQLEELRQVVNKVPEPHRGIVMKKITEIQYNKSGDN